MGNETSAYRVPVSHSFNPDIAAIRNLLTHAFTSQKLRRFCQDRPDFRPILDELGPNSSLNDITDEVIQYCEIEDLFPELLRELLL